MLDAQALAVCKVLSMTDLKRDSRQNLFDLRVLFKTEREDPAQMMLTAHSLPGWSPPLSFAR